MIHFDRGVAEGEGGEEVRQRCPGLLTGPTWTGGDTVFGFVSSAASFTECRRVAPHGALCDSLVELLGGLEVARGAAFGRLELRLAPSAEAPAPPPELSRLGCLCRLWPVPAALALALEVAAPAVAAKDDDAATPACTPAAPSSFSELSLPTPSSVLSSSSSSVMTSAGPAVSVTVAGGSVSPW